VTAVGAINPGLPVEIGRIDKELGKLWEESGDTKTRASLINLAVYTESAESVDHNTRLFADIASQHACRAILIFAIPAAEHERAQAWISAHCHTADKGRQVCSEQITFQLDGIAAAALPNVVFSHLDSDLPLCFWWQADFREPIDEKLWSWVDRLIYDSRTWRDPIAQFPLVRRIGSLGDSRTVLCDLNWARLLNYRFALANFFDHAAALPHLRKIRNVEITHAPTFRTTALLLLGWLAAQLDWTLESVLSRHAFRDPSGAEIHFALREADGASISSCRFDAEGAQFDLTRECHSEFFQGQMAGDAFPSATQVLSAGKRKLVDILLMELSRGGTHPLYLKSLARVEPLL
jgi:glucose-6-phosphate dehydrogenase assembly protein OpcA